MCHSFLIFSRHFIINGISFDIAKVKREDPDNADRVVVAGDLPEQAGCPQRPGTHNNLDLDIFLNFFHYPGY